MVEISKSLKLWEQYGDYVLMALQYYDNVLIEGSGCYIIDADGNKLLDLTSGQFCCLLGYSHPKFLKRLIAQTEKILHTGTPFLSPPVLEASAKFAKIAQGNLKKSIFLSTGTEANECALRIAKTFTQRVGIAGFSRGYYGISLATMSVSKIPASPVPFGGSKHDALPTVPESYTILTPHCFRCPVNSHYPGCNFLCLDVSVEYIGGRLENIAAIIVEPILSAGGMIVPPPGYFKRLKSIAEEYKILLIADEAQTGFGRTGKWFGMEHHEVVPDIMVVSKSAGSGFPVSGVIVTEEIAEKIARRRFIHLSSHQSDPVATAAVSATIDIIEEEGLLQKARENGEYFISQLEKLRKKWPIIADIRGKGLMIGFELVKSPDTLEPANEMAPKLTYACRKKGLHLNFTTYYTVFRISPPLIIEKEQIDFAVSVIDEAIGEVLDGKYSNAEIMPRNPYSKKLSKGTLKRVLYKLWETSPKYWTRLGKKV